MEEQVPNIQVKLNNDLSEIKNKNNILLNSPSPINNFETENEIISKIVKFCI